MSAPAEIEPYLPTFEKLLHAGAEVKARAWWRLGSEIDLLAQEPYETTQIAAIVLSGRVLRRDRTAFVIEVAAKRRRSIPEREVPPSADALGRRQYVVFEVVGDVHDCTGCLNGTVLCTQCNGTGRDAFSFGTPLRGVYGTDVGPDRFLEPLLRSDRCSACFGNGERLCPSCDGTRASITARAYSVQDQEHAFSYAYLPELPFPLEERLKEHFEAELADGVTYPELLTVRLDPERTGGPYRQAVRDATEVYGYAYGRGALAAARLAVQRLRGDEPFFETIRTWARPILWLRYRVLGLRREVAVLCDTAEMRVIVADGSM